MNLERPDLTHVDPEIAAYIEALETQLLLLQAGQQSQEAVESAPEPSEPPTSINVISMSHNGFAKRTPRHFYGRQRRSGMGVFDLDSADDDPPALLSVADESAVLLLFTNFGRAFRMTVDALAEAPVRARGQNVMNLFTFRPHERIVAALPADEGESVALASQRGWVRTIPAVRLNSYLIPGMSFYDVQQGGQVTAACWTKDDDDLFMVTRLGKAIRFAARQVHKSGSLGLRVDMGDPVAAITAVTETSGVFLISHDGKGAIRLMSGFRQNKAPGAGGKVAIKTDKLIGAVTVTPEDDLFLLSKLGKIIRFKAAEVPPKEGVVQGVHCMTLRNDEVTAVARAVIKPETKIED
jgi:DNA gyrase subunit A